MRETKFKAKTVYSEEWVYGHYFNNHDYGCNEDIIINEDGQHVIQSKTVCEYVTDFEDCEGRDCYEDDICTTNIEGELKEGFIYYLDRDLRWVLNVNGTHYPLNEIGVYNTHTNIHD